LSGWDANDTNVNEEVSNGEKGENYVSCVMKMSLDEDFNEFESVWNLYFNQQEGIFKDIDLINEFRMKNKCGTR